MDGYSISEHAEVQSFHVGHGKEPVVVIDNLLEHPQDLVQYALEGPCFEQQSQDFYPGIRQAGPQKYAQKVRRSLEENRYFAVFEASKVDTISCVLSIATVPPAKLRPIQTVPHFDSCCNDSYAMVHYLCAQHHGGTSFYRHKSTGLEKVQQHQLGGYMRTLKAELMADTSHAPAYIHGDTNQFERIGTVPAKFNRAVIYRCSLLHSGDIQPDLGLARDPRKGRLTANLLFTAADPSSTH
ncbi:hypothetical protein HBA55_15080 [Pseudomaricurvus alkylphenolicus]|uniref:DUF6445 family protein n=1 Tax=Pseudomaricurvus alkylphenolicus TaxID=1306991 RepID=UPI001420A39E|nr:DUF6445 family protein [Pseudomaricurvus alkylphenolicus]NIB40924.1 hypothetical protein [Pseudomaricurvus alkylphenolicus]